MNALPTGWRGRLLALGITLLALAALWIGIGGPLTAWYADRAETLRQRQALGHRMAELAETLPVLRQQAETAHAGAPTATALLEGSSDAIAGAKLEELVEAMAQTVGIGLNRVEMLPVEPRGLYSRVGLRVAFAADWPSIVHFLQAVAQTTPSMLVDDLQLRGASGRLFGGDRPAAPVDATLSVMAFRVASAPQGASQ